MNPCYDDGCRVSGPCTALLARLQGATPFGIKLRICVSGEDGNTDPVVGRVFIVTRLQDVGFWIVRIGLKL